MKLIRKRIMAFLLTFVMVMTLMPALGRTTEVKAADYTNGTYSQGEWSATGERVTTWNFTTNMPDSNQTFNENDTVHGITVKGVPSKNKPSLSSNNYLKFMPSSELVIPVSTEATSATVTITTNKNSNSGRSITIGSDTHEYLDSKNPISYTWALSTETIATGQFSAVSVGGELQITEIKLVEKKSTSGGGEGGDIAITGVTVTPKTASVEVGKTVDLSVSFAPTDTTQKDINWTSSNEGIATVDNSGKVTAVAVGTATIKATSATNSTLSDSCEVTVTANTTGGDVAITGVKIEPSIASLKVGEATDLKASVVPANATQTVTWTTSDAGIATVDNTGHVTAVAVGTATITATSAADKSRSASCQVTVTAGGSGNQGDGINAGGWNETIYAQISGISKADVTGVSYSGAMNGTLSGEDFKYLVRDLDGGGSY